MVFWNTIHGHGNAIFSEHKWCGRSLHGFPNIPGGHGSARVIDGFVICMVLVFLYLGVWTAPSLLLLTWSKHKVINLGKQIYSDKILVIK